MPIISNTKVICVELTRDDFAQYEKEEPEAARFDLRTNTMKGVLYWVLAKAGYHATEYIGQWGGRHVVRVVSNE